jgi:hypothetical protein
LDKNFQLIAQITVPAGRAALSRNITNLASAHFDIRVVDRPVMAGDTAVVSILAIAPPSASRSAHTMCTHCADGKLPGAPAEVTTAVIMQPATTSLMCIENDGVFANFNARQQSLEQTHYQFFFQ